MVKINPNNPIRKWGKHMKEYFTYGQINTEREIQYHQSLEEKI